MSLHVENPSALTARRLTSHCEARLKPRLAYVVVAHRFAMHCEGYGVSGCKWLQISQNFLRTCVSVICFCGCHRVTITPRTRAHVAGELPAMIGEVPELCRALARLQAQPLISIELSQLKGNSGLRNIFSLWLSFPTAPTAVSAISRESGATNPVTGASSRISDQGFQSAVLSRSTANA